MLIINLIVTIFLLCIVSIFYKPRFDFTCNWKIVIEKKEKRKEWITWFSVQYHIIGGAKVKESFLKRKFTIYRFLVTPSLCLLYNRIDLNSPRHLFLFMFDALSSHIQLGLFGMTQVAISTHKYQYSYVVQEHFSHFMLTHFYIQGFPPFGLWRGR